MIMKLQITRCLLFAGILATAWNCSESSATQDSASSNTSSLQIPQNIVVSEPSYFYQLGSNYYVIQNARCRPGRTRQDIDCR